MCDVSTIGQYGEIIGMEKKKLPSCIMYLVTFRDMKTRAFYGKLN